MNIIIVSIIVALTVGNVICVLRMLKNVYILVKTNTTLRKELLEMRKKSSLKNEIR